MLALSSSLAGGTLGLGSRGRRVRGFHPQEAPASDLVGHHDAELLNLIVAPACDHRPIPSTLVAGSASGKIAARGSAGGAGLGGAGSRLKRSGSAAGRERRGMGKPRGPAVHGQALPRGREVGRAVGS
jgi:hypothetical protein